MVMTCCLIGGLWRPRASNTQTLVEKDYYFPDMKYKPAQRPTARWVFQGFAVIYLPDRTMFVANLQVRNQTIIDCLGENYQRIYS
jgi:hypothetical protein